MLAIASLALLSGGSSADPVGRLFFTPGQRAAFDTQRNTGIAPVAVEGTGFTPQQAGGEVTLNGIVKRSGGKSTVWVNQVAHGETDSSVDGLKTLPRQARLPSVPLYVPSLGKTVDLKVGQTLDAGTREIRESYQPAAPKESPRLNVPESPSA